jgi:dTDP-4-amino-4,6-dideoxy-D-glucose acyltransferase
MNNQIKDTRYSRDELLRLGFAQVGYNVVIDRSCRFFGAQNMFLGSNVSIDANCVFGNDPTGMRIGSFVHIAVGVTILGAGGLILEDFTGLAAHVCIHTSTDDYINGSMTGPWAPAEFRHERSAPVVLRRHVVVGSGSNILPGVELGIGASIGAMTLIRKSVPSFAVMAGNPARQVAERGRAMLEYEERIRAAFHR